MPRGLPPLDRVRLRRGAKTSRNRVTVGIATPLPQKRRLCGASTPSRELTQRWCQSHAGYPERIDCHKEQTSRRTCHVPTGQQRGRKNLGKSVAKAVRRGWPTCAGGDRMLIDWLMAFIFRSASGDIKKAGALHCGWGRVRRCGADAFGAARRGPKMQLGRMTCDGCSDAPRS